MFTPQPPEFFAGRVLYTSVDSMRLQVRSYKHTTLHNHACRPRHVTFLVYLLQQCQETYTRLHDDRNCGEQGLVLREELLRPWYEGSLCL